jgi:hypothetical protein
MLDHDEISKDLDIFTIKDKTELYRGNWIRLKRMPEEKFRKICTIHVEEEAPVTWTTVGNRNKLGKEFT